MSSAIPFISGESGAVGGLKKTAASSAREKAFNRGVRREEPQRTPSKSSNVFLFSASFAVFLCALCGLKALLSPALIDYFAVEKAVPQTVATGDE